MSAGVERIEASDGYYYEDGPSLSQSDQSEIGNLLIGKSVTKVADDHLLLSDGTLVKLVGNDGGCACSAGCYDLTELNGTENVITNVEFEDKPGSDYADDWHDGYYKIFVLAGDQRINLATFEGSDGNGYYGTGYWILVRKPEVS
ncbi:hypothetical protein GCM10010401_07030 [Rarobacter faecitabidus]|uniref:DUF7448 domain-containing protein n=1 Tax=Rarobacter faecitabidus TaxID=13243 RepID=A0A542ZTF9_RARFA|nr:hypothetical protein [Rarobacter faecitabidus]TQL63549.1 hypothetical protein FB461_0008 [Rarobacter faecitabidus]